MVKIFNLEGLRGFSALIVVFHHLKYAFWNDLHSTIILTLSKHLLPHKIATITAIFVNFFFNGGLAVYIFWLMSAYVISIGLFRFDVSIPAQFVKRYFRLFIPAAVSIILAYLLLKCNLMYNIILANKLGTNYADGWLGAFYNFNPNILIAIKSAVWNTFFNYVPNGTYNSTLWTMEKELFGSLFCYMLYATFKLHRLRYVVYFVLLCISFFLGFYWLSCFIIGFILCDYDYSNRISPYYQKLEKKILAIINNNYIAITLLLVLFFIGGFSNIYNFTYILVSFLMVYLVLRVQILSNFFSLPFLRWLGKISFSLYLIHTLIICSFSSWLYLKLPYSHFVNFVIVTSATLVLCLLFSGIYSKYIDSFSISTSSKIGKLFGK
jgi:peptidoglycan/LPS O-acetylase OafA/YrhL